tara:strand:+ start:278 stop:820 length:543 start_codon:yes stop_codon:yes gene_type:complete
MDNDVGNVRFAVIKDLKYIESLSNKETKAIGFIPKIAYEAAITGIKTGKRWSNVCNDRLFIIEVNDDLVGFCLASFGAANKNIRHGKIAQICLQEDARKIMRGRKLLDAVIEHGYSLYTVGWTCGCADDLESNVFWAAMGWIKVAERKGISHKNTWKQTSKRKINIYKYDIHDMFHRGGV